MKIKHYIAISLMTAGLLILGAGCSSAPVANTQNSVQTNPAQPVAQESLNIAQVARHNTASDCWMAIDGKVYNVTSYLPNHPGGDISVYCGTDASSAFNTRPDGSSHSNRARQTLAQFSVGDLVK